MMTQIADNLKYASRCERCHCLTNVVINIPVLDERDEHIRNALWCYDCADDPYNARYVKRRVS